MKTFVVQVTRTITYEVKAESAFLAQSYVWNGSECEEVEETEETTNIYELR